MGLGTSLVIIAVGAVLRWAVTATTSGINLQTVGLILLIIGVVGFVISLFWIVSNTERGNTIPPDGRPVDTMPQQYRPPQPRV